MTFKMSDVAQTYTIYSFHSTTMEFIGSDDIHIPAHTGLPAYSTEIEPPSIPAGKAVVFSPSVRSWSLVEDHRGQTVYSTASGEAVQISALGELPVGVTTKAPSGSYQKWDGANWVNDAEAKHQAEVRSAIELLTDLMREANAKIAPLNDAVELGIQTDEEVMQLTEWKKYRVALSRIDTATAPDIAWPEFPA